MSSIGTFDQYVKKYFFIVALVLQDVQGVTLGHARGDLGRASREMRPNIVHLFRSDKLMLMCDM